MIYINFVSNNDKINQVVYVKYYFNILVKLLRLKMLKMLGLEILANS